MSRIWARLVEATSRLHRVPLHANEGSRTVADIRAKTRRLKRTQASLGPWWTTCNSCASGRARENR